MQSLAAVPEAEREKKQQEFREAASWSIGRLAAELLTPEQQRRLKEIVLQQEGPLALGQPEIAGALKLTDEQRTRFMAVIQEMQQRMQALQQKTRTGFKPEDVQREAAAIRRQQEGKVEALLSPEQRRQWKEMLGKPLAL